MQNLLFVVDDLHFDLVDVYQKVRWSFHHHYLYDHLHLSMDVYQSFVSTFYHPNLDELCNRDDEKLAMSTNGLDIYVW